MVTTLTAVVVVKKEDTEEEVEAMAMTPTMEAVTRAVTVVKKVGMAAKRKEDMVENVVMREVAIIVHRYDQVLVSSINGYGINSISDVHY